jgi:predicted kinase
LEVPQLIILAGLPGSGKTTIARAAARQLGAVHVRIDSIEQAMRESGAMTGPLDDAGYRVGYAVAGDNLRIGRIVVADSVNPLQMTRDAWVAVAQRERAAHVEVEIVCSDPIEHRDRVERMRPPLLGRRDRTALRRLDARSAGHRQRRAHRRRYRGRAPGQAQLVRRLSRDQPIAIDSRPRGHVPPGRRHPHCHPFLA